MFDVWTFHLLLLTVTGWLDRRERDALAYLLEENRVASAGGWATLAAQR